MNTQILLLAVIALAGLGVIMISFDSEVTGQGVKILKLPAETNKAFVEAVGKGSQTPASDPCGCKGLYGGNIATKDTDVGSVGFAGLSAFDCILIDEIVKLRKELKLQTSQFDAMQAICNSAGY